jgi:dTDP-4-dehydrorhamnose 3,5-epimerase
MARLEPSAIAGVMVLDGFSAADLRGSLTRLYPLGPSVEAFQIEQVLVSRNLAAGTLRGMHFQAGEWAEQKIVSVLNGRILDVLVDVRAGSSTYLAWTSVEIAADRPTALFVPRGLAHGFITLEPDTQVTYLLDRPYVPTAGRGIRWNDPAIGVEWPAAPAVVSEQDQGWPDTTPEFDSLHDF